MWWYREGNKELSLQELFTYLCDLCAFKCAISPLIFNISPLIFNRTLVPLPASRKLVSCKSVFKIKQGANGEVERYKARLVARGFTQTYGVDYNETFVPVGKFTSICCILALAALETWRSIKWM